MAKSKKTPSVAEQLKSRLNPLSKGQAPHVIGKAGAGTGKTTTVIEGLKDMKGQPTKIDPSPEQRAIWDSIRLSKDARTICLCAFNKSIATELQTRVPAGVDAMTMHSMGFKAVRNTFKLRPGRDAVAENDGRGKAIISELLERDLRDLWSECPVLLKATVELVNLCKANLLEGTEEELAYIVCHFDVELANGQSYRDEVFSLVPQVLARCKNVAKDGYVDFIDMIWLPVVLNLPLFRYDLLIVDEAQDLNRCQQELAKRAGKRLMFIGDERQAIYGFTGADCESMRRLERELSESPLGCVALPLTVTRRCGKAIVREANKVVSDFHAHESNPEGKVSEALYPTKRGSSNYWTGGDDSPVERPLAETYIPLVNDGDMVLCRVNAPLVSQCFKFIRLGRKANIQGRDIGAGLVKLVNKMKANSVEQLITHLTEWADKEVEKEQAKKNPSEARVIAITDRLDCLMVFTDQAETVAEVVRKIETIFVDSKDVLGIRLSSIHKAKGLEADRVFLLMPEGGQVPHPMAKSQWQVEQEWNLFYVAVTRAKHELIYVRQ